MEMIDYLFHPADHLPTPTIPLLVRLDDGQVIEAIRPGYIADRRHSDLGYRTMDGGVLLNVTEWAIK